MSEINALNLHGDGTKMRSDNTERGHVIGVISQAGRVEDGYTNNKNGDAHQSDVDDD